MEENSTQEESNFKITIEKFLTNPETDFLSCSNANDLQTFLECIGVAPISKEEEDEFPLMITTSEGETFDLLKTSVSENPNDQSGFVVLKII